MHQILKGPARLGWGFRPLLAAVLAAFVFTLSLLSCASGAAGRGGLYGGLGQPEDPVPFMKEVRTGTLPNGLRYYILQNARPENRAFLTLAVNAGSVLETDDEQGLAHFVEHMAFNGTARFPEMELLDYLRSLGMRFGADANAYTSYDETVYGIEVPTEISEDGLKHIPAKALAMIDDWTYAITFAPADVDDERSIIMEEYRTRLGANERVFQKMIPVLLRGSPYAVRRPIGLPEIIQNAPASTLEGFYKKWYRTDNMAVILVGDFDGAALEAELASHFTAPAPSEPTVRPYYELPKPEKGGFRVEIITDPEYQYTRIDAYYKENPQPLTGTIASFRQGVLEMLVSQIIDNRFEEAVLKPETPYSNGGVWESRYGRESQFYVFSVISKPGTARESFAAVMREKESILRYGFTNAEIDRAKRSLVSNLMRIVSEQDRQLSNRYISDFTAHFLRNENTADPEWELEAVTRLLPGIRPKELTRTVKDHLAGNDLTVIVLAPGSESANLPTEAEIRKIVAGSKRLRIKRPKETALGDELLDREPERGSITGEKKDGDSGAVLWELSNGARVILKETANKNNEIVLTALARGGVTAASKEEHISVSLAAEMAEASGLGPYSRTELVQKLAGKQAAISFSTAGFSRAFSGSTTTGDLKTLFELLYLAFTQPRIENSAVQALLDQYRTSLAQRKEKPETVFSDEVNRVIFGDSYYFRPLELASLEKFDIAQARAFLEKAVNPADYTFVFTGNVGLAGGLTAFRDYVETYLASIPPKESWNSFADIKINRPVKSEHTVYSGKEEKSMVFLGWFLGEAWTEERNAAASVLTEYLDIKLNEEIREKLGGVYSIGVNVSSNFLPPQGELIMNSVFYCDPSRAVEISNAIETQLKLIADGTINQDTFTKAVEALKKSREESEQYNGFIASSYARLAVIYQAPLSKFDAETALYEAVRSDDIQDICRKLLPQGPVRIILYPEGWSGVMPPDKK
ncbi:MAG: insulinase family protein [Treponema sp.]|nr:insulinase family protein [Treponema sp.]